MRIQVTPEQTLTDSFALPFGQKLRVLSVAPVIKLSNQRGANASCPLGV